MNSAVPVVWIPRPWEAGEIVWLKHVWHHKHPAEIGRILDRPTPEIRRKALEIWGNPVSRMDKPYLHGDTGAFLPDAARDIVG